MRQGLSRIFQAVRYAAFCSTMTVEKVTGLYAEFAKKGDIEEARRRILEFVGVPDFFTLAAQAHPITPTPASPPPSNPAPTSLTRSPCHTHTARRTSGRLRAGPLPYPRESRLQTDSPPVARPTPPARPTPRPARACTETRRCLARGRNTGSDRIAPKSRAWWANPW